MNLINVIMLCLFVVKKIKSQRICQLYLYQHENLGGRSWGPFDAGTWNEGWFWNDEVTSAELYALNNNYWCRARFYKHHGCTDLFQTMFVGWESHYIKTNHLHQNDELSCVKVYAYRKGSAAGVSNPRSINYSREEEVLSPEEQLEWIPFGTTRWRVNLSSPWVIGIVLVLGIILFANIVCVCYTRYFKNSPGRNGYSSVKIVDDSNSEDLDESEAKLVIDQRQEQ